MEYKDFYKTRRIPSLADALARRCQNVIAERNEKRRELFWGRRGCMDGSPGSKPDPLEKKKKARAEMLQKWKEEKRRKVEEAKKNQKPVFKVGVIQRKVTGSPITQQKTHIRKNTVQKPNQTKAVANFTETQRIMTRSRAKKSEVTKASTKSIVESQTIIKTQDKFKNAFCKIDTGKKKKVNSSVFTVPEVISKLPYSNLTFPYSPKMSRRSKRLIKPEENTSEILKEKLEEFNIVKAHESAEVKRESREPEKLVTPEKADDFVPIHYSPFVTIRSGKKSVKKTKMSLTMDVDEQIKKEEKEFRCRIFSFRKYIECETKRLLDACEKWKHIYQEVEEVPLDVEGDIDCVIGKTNLLTSDKFKQFKGLIDKCENGDPLIKVDDLQGFQDWVSIEVERIDEDFHKLEKRKLNNWVVETAAVEVGKMQKMKVAKNGAKKPKGRSNIRSHILAARKLLKEGNAEGVPTSFDEVLKVTTPKNKQNLLKEVLTSETKKKTELPVKMSPILRVKRNSGLEIMIASQKNKLSSSLKISPKTASCEFFVTTDTPSRSILKKTPRTLNSSKGRVTFKKLTENVIAGPGLNEKYFQPLMDDECSPMRMVLGDLGNLTPGGMTTRSRSKQFSVSAHLSPHLP